MRLKSTTTAAIAMITLLVCGAALLSSINARALQQGEGPDAAGERGPGPVRERPTPKKVLPPPPSSSYNKETNYQLLFHTSRSYVL